MSEKVIRIAVGCGAGTLGLALMVFCGWALKIAPLTTVFPGFVPMVPWTASALVLSGGALILATLHDRWPPARWLQCGGALAIGAIALIILLEYATGMDWGFDRLWFSSSVAELSTRFPGRPAGATAVLFVILSLAMSADSFVGPGGRFYAVLTNLGLLVSSLPLLGYAFSAEPFYTSIPYSTMALPTAVAMVILFVGMLAARPSHGWIALLVSDSLGGMVTRRLLPVVIGVPLTMSISLLWISRQTHMEPDFRLAISTVAVVVILLCLVVRDARRIERLDRERQAALSALVHAKEQAEAASHAKSAFLANMSHELRTPLSAILGFSQLLELEQGQSESYDTCVEHISKNGKHLLALINDLLDLAKIDAGQISTSPERVVLDELLVGLKASLLSLAEAAGITLLVPVSAGLPDVRADQTRLNQVLLNLGNNAIKYNRPGGRVEITSERLGSEWLRLTVADTGLGIPEERQSELFEPFNRLGREAGSIDGTGIGLALSRRLMHLMGGKIGFSSRVDEGSRFWIDLPVYVATHHDDDILKVTVQRPPEHTDEPASEAGRTVLCVDDNAAARELVTKIIVGIPGTRVLTAGTAEAGIELARREQPDLILMDINLPGMNGIAALKELRRRVETRSIPVFALSAAATAADIDKGLAAGFDRYMTKPYDVRELLSAVRASLLEEPVKD